VPGGNSPISTTYDAFVSAGPKLIGSGVSVLRITVRPLIVSMPADSSGASTADIGSGFAQVPHLRDASAIMGRLGFPLSTTPGRPVLPAADARIPRT
jgi:hypothetical protein